MSTQNQFLSTSTVSVDVTRTITIELTLADKIALNTMLHYPVIDQHGHLIKHKVTAIKYLRARFALNLQEAKQIMDHIDCHPELVRSSHAV